MDGAELDPALRRPSGSVNHRIVMRLRRSHLRRVAVVRIASMSADEDFAYKILSWEEDAAERRLPRGSSPTKWRAVTRHITEDRVINVGLAVSKSQPNSALRDMRKSKNA